MILLNNLKWKGKVRFQKGENKSLVASTENGQCFFVSNECLDILNCAMSSKLTEEDLLNEFEDSEDREYMSQLISKLRDLSLLANDKSEEVNANEIEIS